MVIIFWPFSLPEIDYVEEGSTSLRVRFVDGENDLALDKLEVTIFLDGDEHVCLFDDDSTDKCWYYVVSKEGPKKWNAEGSWNHDESLRLYLPDTFSANYAKVLQLEIRYEGDLLPGSNKEINLED